MKLRPYVPSRLLAQLAFASALAACAAPEALAQAIVWDASQQYSSTQNPSGVWSYGWSLNSGAPLNPFLRNNITFCSPLVSWSNQFPLYPLVSKNESGGTVCCSSIRVPPQGIVLHPGQAGENAVLRFTVPEDGFYWVEIEFAGVDFNFPTNSDVSILKNLSQVFTAELNSYNGPANCTSTSAGSAYSFKRVFDCFQGDTIDANVGFGFRQRYNGDSTMVRFRVTRVATVETVGAPCRGRAQHGSSGPPRLGLTLTLGLVQAATGSPGLLDLGVGPPRPLPLGGCTIYPDLLNQLATIPLTTNGLGQWQVTIPLPGDPAFHGFQITTQALVANPRTPGGLETSNGLLLTL